MIDTPYAVSTMKNATIRKVADVFLRHEATYEPDATHPTVLADQLLQNIAADLDSLFRQPFYKAENPDATLNDSLGPIYNAVYMLDERPFAYLPHHQAAQIHYFMRRFRNSGGWKYIFPWKRP